MSGWPSGLCLFIIESIVRVHVGNFALLHLSAHEVRYGMDEWLHICVCVTQACGSDQVGQCGAQPRAVGLHHRSDHGEPLRLARGGSDASMAWFNTVYRRA